MSRVSYKVKSNVLYLNVFHGPVCDVLLSDIDEHNYADQATVLYQGVARTLRGQKTLQLLPPLHRSLQQQQ